MKGMCLKINVLNSFVDIELEQRIYIWDKNKLHELGQDILKGHHI